MAAGWPEEEFLEERVKYTLEVAGRFVVVENVPARVSARTGERFFAPDTVQRLQKIVWEQQTPCRIVETPVFEFSSVVA